MHVPPQSSQAGETDAVSELRNAPRLRCGSSLIPVVSPGENQERDLADMEENCGERD
jgi:hypothetical protein